MRFKFLSKIFFCALLLSHFAPLITNANPMRPPSEPTIAEARTLVEAMKKNTRGPYKQIRWFCHDGSILPPKPYACLEHGGGNQYGQYSEERARLAALGWPVGTILTALSWDEFWDVNRRHQRMRDIPLEKYLVDIDNGWVLQKAKHYRGRLQIEDEELHGRKLLLQLAQQPKWLTDHYFLMRELIRTIPHGSGNDTTRDMRRIAQNIAEQETSFENLRIEIHSAPSAQTMAHVQAWKSRFHPKPGQETLVAQTNELVQKLEQLYGEAGRQQRLTQVRKAISQYPSLSHMHSLLVTEPNESELKKMERQALLLAAIRDVMATQISANKRLELLDSIADIEAELRLSASTVLLSPPFERQFLLQMARLLVIAAYGGGYLSANEKDIIIDHLTPALAKDTLAFEDYLGIIDNLNMTSTWALGAVRYTFAEALVRYSALDARASTFIDDILRGSPLLLLARITRHLTFDAQSISQVKKMLFGQPATALMALNPGLAIGPLYVATEQQVQNGLHLSRDHIVVLPQTVSELSPVAGIMTIGESNMLSHVQLLARNFGIPNVALTLDLLDKLKPYHGQTVVLIAANDGSVIVSNLEKLTPVQQQLINSRSATSQAKLTAPSPNLEMIRPLPINKISLSLSGKAVGPKAANLSELYRLFPGKVAPSIALPFGLFFKEINHNTQTNWKQLETLYQQSRAGDIDQDKLNVQLEQLRTAVLNSKTSTALRNELMPLMQQWFGEDGQYGVFVRSDTNVEDLPGFTGAGLSETLPNLVGYDAVFNGIPRVWASVLAPRAIAWRSNLLTNPEYVYPSVLIMKSVAAEKSGVLVTSDLHKRKTGLTVSTAWGVGGAVNGEVAEVLVLKPDGSEMLLTEAKTPYQRALLKQGGIEWIPAPAGTVLTADEKRQLRELAQQVNTRYGIANDGEGNTLPWDIEFGFLQGKLQLFQIRPLIERGQAVADRIIHANEQPVKNDKLRLINLKEPAIDMKGTP